MVVRPSLSELSQWTPWCGRCEGCWAGCCHLPVDVTTGDLTRLGWIGPDGAASSAAMIFIRLKGAGRLSAWSPRAGTFILAQRPDGACHLLGGDGRCTAYEDRPDACRTFPAVGPRPGFCPSAPLQEDAPHA